MKQWAMWTWTDAVSRDERDLGIKTYRGMGALAEHLRENAGRSGLDLGEAELHDLRSRISMSRRILGLPEQSQRLTRNFLEAGFIAEYLRQSTRRQAKRQKE